MIDDAEALRVALATTALLVGAVIALTAAIWLR